MKDNSISLRHCDKNMIDLEKLKQGDYLLQCFAMFVRYKNKDVKFTPLHF